MHQQFLRTSDMRGVDWTKYFQENPAKANRA